MKSSTFSFHTGLVEANLFTIWTYVYLELGLQWTPRDGIVLKVNFIYLKKKLSTNAVYLAIQTFFRWESREPKCKKNNMSVKKTGRKTILGRGKKKSQEILC